MRLGEGVSLSGSLDPDWGRQGRGVCGGSKWHGGVIEEIGVRLVKKKWCELLLYLMLQKCQRVTNKERTFKPAFSKAFRIPLC